MNAHQRCLLLSGIGLTMCLVGAERAAAKITFAHQHGRGKIRVFYNTEGQHAVDPTDLNRNSVPDRVEDLLTQTQAALTLFVDVLGFPDPFQTERFHGAAFLDIHLLDKKTLGSNGVAYDELQRYRRAQDPPNATSLCFNVATSVDAAKNLTPAHELFHLLQYSVTYFKNGWYLEGLARWSERALGAGAVGPVRPQGPGPVAEQDPAALFEMRYEAAERFWNPLAVLDDPQGVIPDDRVKPELRDLTYVNGERVLQDQKFTGWKLIRDVLVELGQRDRVAFRELGYADWSEANQKSPRNNRYIFEAVADVVRRHGHPWPPSARKKSP